MKHFDFEKLVRNFEGSLPAAETLAVSEHLRNCKRCAADAKKLEKFFSYLHQDGGDKVSQATTARLLNIFESRETAGQAQRESFGRRILASLVFDDWQTALNERLAAADARQMLFAAGNYQIDLRFEFAEGKCRVSGQIFPDCPNSATAEIFSSAANEKVSLDDDCEFVFPPLSPGIYKLRLNLSGETVEIENLSLDG